MPVLSSSSADGSNYREYSSAIAPYRPGYISGTTSPTGLNMPERGHQHTADALKSWRRLCLWRFKKTLSTLTPCHSPSPRRFPPPRFRSLRPHPLLFGRDNFGSILHPRPTPATTRSLSQPSLSLHHRRIPMLRALLNGFRIEHPSCVTSWLRCPPGSWT